MVATWSTKRMSSSGGVVGKKPLWFVTLSSARREEVNGVDSNGCKGGVGLSLSAVSNWNVIAEKRVSALS